MNRTYMSSLERSIFDLMERFHLLSSLAISNEPTAINLQIISQMNNFCINLHFVIKNLYNAKVFSEKDAQRLDRICHEKRQVLDRKFQHMSQLIVEQREFEKKAKLPKYE